MRYRLNMFGLSGEHLLILAGVLLIFGPRKLPEFGASLGKALRNFKEGLSGPTNSGQLDSPPASRAIQVPQQSPVAQVQTPEDTNLSKSNSSAANDQPVA